MVPVIGVKSDAVIGESMTIQCEGKSPKKGEIYISIKLSGGEVTFRYKNRCSGDCNGLNTISHEEGKYT